MPGFIPPLPQYILAWCLDNQRDDLVFYMLHELLCIDTSLWKPSTN